MEIALGLGFSAFFIGLGIYQIRRGRILYGDGRRVRVWDAPPRPLLFAVSGLEVAVGLASLGVAGTNLFS